MRSPEHELSRPADCDTSQAEFKLRQMETVAPTSRNIAGKWLSVFKNDDGELIYAWQGGYPSQIVSRAAALSVLVYA